MIYAESSTLRTAWMGVLRCSIIYSVNMQYDIKGLRGWGYRQREQTREEKSADWGHRDLLSSTSKPSCDSLNSSLFKISSQEQSFINNRNITTHVFLALYCLVSCDSSYSNCTQTSFGLIWSLLCFLFRFISPVSAPELWLFSLPQSCIEFLICLSVLALLFRCLRSHSRPSDVICYLQLVTCTANNKTLNLRFSILFFFLRFGPFIRGTEILNISDKWQSSLCLNRWLLSQSNLK